MVNIDVFMRFAFSVFSAILACKLRLWDLILEDLEGPGLPYMPPGHALLRTAEIHDFQVPPRILVELNLEGELHGLAALNHWFSNPRTGDQQSVIS